VAKFNPVQAWLDNVAYGHSKSRYTAYYYQHYFKRFCDFIECTPQQILDDYENSNERQFKRKYGQLVRAYISNVSNGKYAAATVTAMITPIKSFFKYNDLPLGYIPSGTMKVTYHNRDITREEILEIMKISNPRERAFYCVMAQSGLRPNTLCSLKLKHVENLMTVKEGKSCRITVPSEITKGGYHGYFSFIGPESVKHLKTYLLKRRKAKPDDYLFASYGSDKKLNPKSISNIFARTVERLKDSGVMSFNQKKEGKPREVRLYSLRKWFRKQAGHAGSDFVNFWMGHSLGVDAHYFSRDPEHHRKQYEEKALPHLRLETVTPSETEQIIEQLKRQMKDLQEQFKDLQESYEMIREVYPEEIKWVEDTIRIMNETNPSLFKRMVKMIEEKAQASKTKRQTQRES